MKKVDKRSEVSAWLTIFEMNLKLRSKALRVIRAETRLTVYCSFKVLKQELREPDRAGDKT